MKILVCCPGSWSHGLYSPERGEGRWAQNFARMLAEAGYDVWACSGGKPKEEVHLGVKIVNERKARSEGKFDLYFDSAWYEGKNKYADADKYFAVMWQPERRFYTPNLPKDMHLAFPFEYLTDKFKSKTNPWRDKTFCLPSRYCSEFGKPHFGKKKFIWSCRDSKKKTCDPVIAALNIQYNRHGLTGIWMNSSSLDKNGRWEGINKKVISKKINYTPYNKIREAIDSAGLMVPVEGRSSVLDSISLGVAPLAYEGGISFPYVRKVARECGLILPKGYKESDVLEVIDKLVTDEPLYMSYVLGLQQHITAHTQAGSLAKFEEMVESVYRV